jgi:hypothetical protein
LSIETPTSQIKFPLIVSSFENGKQEKEWEKMARGSVLQISRAKLLPQILSYTT